MIKSDRETLGLTNDLHLVKIEEKHLKYLKYHNDNFDQEYKVVLSPRILEQESKGYFEKHFGSVNHLQLAIPEEYKPNKSFLEWHMDTVFQR